MDKREERHPVPGEGNMVYPDGQEEPVQGEETPDKGLQEKKEDAEKK